MGGVRWTREAREKVAASNRKRVGVLGAHYGKKHKHESLYAIGSAMRGKHHRPEVVAQIRRKVVAWIESGGRMAPKWRDTKPELAMKAWLEARGVEFQQQVGMFGHLWDFAVPSLKLFIEVDGCYWHGCPTHHPASAVGRARREKDALHDAAALENGWRVMRIWEHDLV